VTSEERGRRGSGLCVWKSCIGTTRVDHLRPWKRGDKKVSSKTSRILGQAEAKKKREDPNPIQDLTSAEFGA